MIQLTIQKKETIHRIIQHTHHPVSFRARLTRTTGSAHQCLSALREFQSLQSNLRMHILDTLFEFDLCPTYLYGSKGATMEYEAL